MAERTLSPGLNGEIRNALEKHAKDLRTASERARDTSPEAASRYMMRCREVEGLAELFASRATTTVLIEEM